MQNRAEEALTLYRTAQADRTDTLIAHLRDITLAYTQEGTRDQRLTAVETLLEKDAEQILAAIEALADTREPAVLSQLQTLSGSDSSSAVRRAAKNALDS